MPWYKWLNFPLGINQISIYLSLLEYYLISCVCAFVPNFPCRKRKKPWWLRCSALEPTLQRVWCRGGFLTDLSPGLKIPKFSDRWWALLHPLSLRLWRLTLTDLPCTSWVLQQVIIEAIFSGAWHCLCVNWFFPFPGDDFSGFHQCHKEKTRDSNSMTNKYSFRPYY